MDIDITAIREVFNLPVCTITPCAAGSVPDSLFFTRLPNDDLCYGELAEGTRRTLVYGAALADVDGGTNPPDNLAALTALDFYKTLVASAICAAVGPPFASICGVISTATKILKGLLGIRQFAGYFENQARTFYLNARNNGDTDADVWELVEGDVRGQCQGQLTRNLDACVEAVHAYLRDSAFPAYYAYRHIDEVSADVRTRILSGAEGLWGVGGARLNPTKPESDHGRFKGIWRALFHAIDLLRDGFDFLLEAHADTNPTPLLAAVVPTGGFKTNDAGTRFAFTAPIQGTEKGRITVKLARLGDQTYVLNVKARRADLSSATTDAVVTVRSGSALTSALLALDVSPPPTTTTMSTTTTTTLPCTFLAKWGSYGTGDGEFSAPRDVAVDGSGNVYVADSDNYRIQKFTSDGTFLTKWGSYGTGDGEFDRPASLAVDGSGNVYVSETYPLRIQKFTSDGTFLAKWESFPDSGLAVDGSGNVYVSGGSRIQKFTSDGTFLTQWGSFGTGDGEFFAHMGVAVDGNSNVYVADSYNYRIQKFTSDGTFLTKWGSYGTGDGEFSDPWDIAVDGSGNVYVADIGNSRIQKFTSNGAFLTKWGTLGSGDSPAGPWGVAVDASGNVYVADIGNSRIQKFACP